MAVRNTKTLKIPPDTHTQLNTIRFRVAAETNELPEFGDIISALVEIGSKHQEELIRLIQGENTQ
jgi:hypothetical protein